jgi:large subunit ribosomal protein L22
MDVSAKLRYLRITPRKVRLVIDAIRGKSVVEADAMLSVIPKHSSLPLRKLIASAVANAEHNFQLKKEDLIIKSIVADEGPKLKRFRPRAFGRAADILKRSSHVTVVLSSDKPAKKGKPSMPETVKASATVRRSKKPGTKLPPPANEPKPQIDMKETKAEAHDAPVHRGGAK